MNKAELRPELQKLLRKTKPTAQELGIIAIANFAIISDQTERGEEPELIYNAEKFQQKLDALDGRGRAIYGLYRNIEQWINVVRRNVLVEKSQFEIALNDLMHTISLADLSEDVFIFNSQLPLIMTRSQYEKEVTSRRYLNYHYQDGTSVKYYGYNIFTEALDYYLNKLFTERPVKDSTEEEEEEENNPLKKIRKIYDSLPLTDVKLLQDYCRLRGLGYYILADGTRSDKPTMISWQSALADNEINLATLNAIKKEGKLNIVKTTDGGDDITEITLLLDIINKRPINGSVLKEIATPETIHKAYTEAFGGAIEWKYYDEPSDINITKWNLFEIPELITDLFEPLFLPFLYSDEEVEKEYLRFKETFPELAAELIKDIAQHFPEIEAMGENDFMFNTPYSWETLYTHNIYGTKSKSNRIDILFSENARAINNGIAVIETPVKGSKTDNLGYYKQPQLFTSMFANRLNSYFKEIPANEKARQEEAYKYRRIADSYASAVAFNAVVDFSAEVYKTPELTLFKIDIAKEYDRFINAYNKIVEKLSLKILYTDYNGVGGDELKEKKRAVLKEVFAPLNSEEFRARVKAENVEKAKQLLLSGQAFVGGKERLYTTALLGDEE